MQFATPMSDDPINPRSQLDRDFSRTRWAVWLPIIVSISVSFGGVISWIYAQYEANKAAAAASNKAISDENNRFLVSQLIPIQIKLNKTKSVYEQLSNNYNLDGYGALESYVIMARKEGIEKLTLQYALLTDIAQLDTEISVLLESCTPYFIDNEFKKESDMFLEHAHTYIIRFKSLQNIVHTNAPLPSWKPFPEGLPSALNDEIKARKNLINTNTKSINQNAFLL